MTTPTMGELERRVADLEARGEEWDEAIGMADGESKEYEDTRPSFVGERTGRMGTLSDANRDVNTGAPVIVPFSGEDRCPATLDWSFRDFLVYSDDYGTHWITSHPILTGDRQGIPFRGADDLRELADRIEEAEQ